MLHDIVNLTRNALDADLVVLQDENNAAMLQRLYDHECLTLEGVPTNHQIYGIANRVWDYVKVVKDNHITREFPVATEYQEKELPERCDVYIVSGAVMNQVYHLTGDNAYQPDFHLMIIDDNHIIECKAMVKEDVKFGIRQDKTFRYFSDVVDNNARREIRKGNEWYKDYHSLYGDEWFYSTI